MIELKLDSVKEQMSLEHDMCCEEHIVDEIKIILDVIITDYAIKIGRNNDFLERRDIHELLWS